MGYLYGPRSKVTRCAVRPAEMEPTDCRKQSTQTSRPRHQTNDDKGAEAGKTTTRYHEHMDQTAQTTAKPWYQKWWIWLIAAIIVIGGIGNLIDGDQEPEPAATIEPAATPTPTDEPAEEPEQTKEPEAQPIAEDITNTILTDNGVTTFQGLDATSPGFWIATIEDNIPGTVRVTIQDNLNDEGRDKTARWIANMTCTNTPTLDTIIIQDTTGRDSNHYLKDMPLPNTCQN